MPKGGDRRPIVRPEGRDLAYASLLCQAMVADTSDAGLEFNRERETLFQRWQRLIRALSRHNVPGFSSPPSTLDKIDDYLNQASFARPVHYPKPRPLTSTQLLLESCLATAASEAQDAMWGPALIADDPEAWATWNTGCHSPGSLDQASPRSLTHPRAR